MRPISIKAVAEASQPDGLVLRWYERVPAWQMIYSALDWNPHFQNVPNELARLGQFLQENEVAVSSAVDIGCGDGAITARLREMLGLQRISGVDLNHDLAERARARGVEVIEADMETLTASSRYDLVVSYGSLHHSADTSRFVRTLGRLSNLYVLIVDNTVRDNLFHKVTGSRHFPLELSPYRIRSCEEIVSAFDGDLRVVASATSRNANVFHDRSFILARRTTAND